MKLDKLKEVLFILLIFFLSIVILKYLKVIKILFLLLKILIPLFIGYIYAWLLNPLIDKLNKFFNRKVSCVLVFLFILLFVFIFLYSLIPIITKEIHELVEMMPQIYSEIIISSKRLKMEKYIGSIFKYFENKCPLYLVSCIKGILSFSGTFVIGLILGLYISMEYDEFARKVSKLSYKYKCFVAKLIKDISENVRRCVNGTLFVSFIVFILDTLGFTILGLDVPILLGFFCGITDLIPYVGPYIGGLLAVLVAFTKGKKLGILAIVVCFIVQSIENYVLQPIVMSKSIRISPVMVMVGLLVFGNLFGVVGMIISTPCMAMIKVVWENVIIKQLDNVNYFN